MKALHESESNDEEESDEASESNDDDIDSEEGSSGNEDKFLRFASMKSDAVDKSNFNSHLLGLVVFSVATLIGSL